MAAGSKRSAPADLDTTAELRAPTRPRRSAPPARAADSPLAPPVGDSYSTSVVDTPAADYGEHAGSALEKWAVVLEGRIHRAGDGQVVMTKDEAQELCSDMMHTIESYLEAPASRSDVLNLMAQVSRMSESLSYATAQPASPLYDAASPVFTSVSPRRAPTPPPRRPRATFAGLPFDILRLILLELRAMTLAEADGPYLGARHGQWAFWRFLPQLAALSSSLKEVCTSLYHAELVVVDIKQIPERAKYYATRPHRAAALQSMTLRTYDFEYALGRSSEDAGFMLPDLISAAPNLKELVLSSERESTFGSAERFSSRSRRSTFETLTGGVSVPSTIVSSLASSLRTLVYGAPCSLADVVTFASELPALERLDVLGEVDHAARDTPFKTVSRSSRRLWLPSTALSAAELGALLAADDVLDDPMAERDVRVESLAFTFDAEQCFAPVPPPPHVVAEEIGFLVSLFGVIGADLRELAISTPLADSPDGGFGRIRIGGGPGGPGGPGGWGQGLVVILGPGGAGQAGAGAGGGGAGGAAAGAGGQRGAPQGQQGGGAQAAQPAPAPAVPPVAAQAGPVPAAALPGRTTRSRAAAAAQPAQVHVGAGAGPARVVPPAQAPAPQQAAAPAPAPARAARAHAPPPPPNPAGAGAANPPGFNLLNPLTWLGGGPGAPGGAGAAAPPPVDPFFESLLEYTPNLEHVELYGRRYTAAVVERLAGLPLRHLSLSVPDEGEQQAVVDQLLEALEGGCWEGLRRIELSGRGGEWGPSQRRAVKVEAEKRKRVVYKSTDMRP
ncbi:hypothetical protein JCM8208_001372 [Rhodotorula glutinis]